jgi:hypothetical protein
MKLFIYLSIVDNNGRGLKYELSSPAWTLGSSVRIPHQALISVSVYSLFVLSYLYWKALRQAIPRPGSPIDCDTKLEKRPGPNMWVYVLSCDIVTVDGVWIGNRIYWDLTECNYTSYYSANTNSHTHYSSLQDVPSPLSLLHLHQLSPGNGFQCRIIFNFCVHVLNDRRLFHN